MLEPALQNCKGPSEAGRKVRMSDWKKGLHPFDSELIFKISLLIFGFMAGALLLIYQAYSRVR
jgi:hypothetical protein